MEVVNDRIRWVGPWRDLPSDSKGPLIDLGDGLLMPGLVNAHAHLDYTGMAGLIPPRRSFADWIKSINALKGATSLEEYEKAWKQGAEMLVRSGTSTVANICAIPELVPGLLSRTALRVFACMEVIGIKPDRDPVSFLAPALECLDRCRLQGCLGGLSPHSLYATTPGLMQLCIQTALQNNWLLTTHLAESLEEYEMFQSARGPLYDWLRTQRDMSDCGHGTPAALLEQLDIPAGRVLVAHANYLAPEDIDLLARRRVSVVHCPHSHAYFQHRPFPLQALTNAGVTVCLGTDSLASRESVGGVKPVLDMRSEMRILSGVQPDLSAEHIVRMATLQGAHALGMQGQIGEITPGALADLVAFPILDSSHSPYEEVIRSSAPVLASLREGQWVIPPCHLTTGMNADAC